MHIKPISTSVLLASAFLASAGATHVPHHAKRTDCPMRMKRQVAATKTGIGAQVVSSFTVSDLAAFTASIQAGQAAAPPAPTAQPSQAYGNGNDQARDSPLPVLTTADFGDFFDTTGAGAAGAAATAGALQIGIGASVLSSFTVSDLKSFTEAAAAGQATAASAAATAAPASNGAKTTAPASNGAKTTGIGARPVSSFTVSDLAAFTGSAGAQPSATIAASPSSAIPSAPAAPAGKQVGIGAKVVGYCILDQKALMDATGAWPEVWGPKTASAGEGAYGASGDGSYASSWVSSSGAPAAADATAVTAASASQSSRTFVPTTTGIGAKTLASFSTELDSLATAPGASTATSSDAAAPPASSSAPASSGVSDPALAPAADPASAEANTDGTVEIPGQRLSVLPIGLGVFGGLAGVGLIVVAWVSYERRKYRKQFRDRKTAERIQNAINMRQAV